MNSTGSRKPETENRVPIPQTNLQLYRAMLEQGHCEESLGRANEAWLLAASNTAGMFRGSGKPFCCHLAGVAGLLCDAGLPEPAIVAGLLHAMYQDRVPFEGLTTTQRRERIKAHFGNECERLVHDYHEFEVQDLEQWSDEALLAKGAVVLMRVADELEDMIDDAIAVHGRPDDQGTVPGGAADRRIKALRLGPELQRAARVCDNAYLTRQLDYWLRRVEAGVGSCSARSGKYSSYSV